MEYIKGMPIISIGEVLSDKRKDHLANKWSNEVAHRYAICRLHLKYARRYLEDGSVDQFWEALQSFMKARKVARVVRKLAKGSK